MNIDDTRKCNQWNLRQVADFLGDRDGELHQFYTELLDDSILLKALNERIAAVRQAGFDRAIFSRGELDSVDWFAFERILLYVLVRYLKPLRILETGVFYGGNTAFLLAGLHANQQGGLVSIDLPASRMDDDFVRSRHSDVGDSERYSDELSVGFIIPDYLRERWHFIEGDSREHIPRQTGSFDLFVHDSEHSHDFVLNELRAVHPKLSPAAAIVADDIDWSNGFFAFCVEQRLLPLLLTDNGKDDLRVRMGVAKLDHPRNSQPESTGA